MIYQNDQYYLKIMPIFNNRVVVDCDEMVIKLGSIVKKKSLNEIEYNEELNCWLFPLTIEETNANVGSQCLQAWFSFGNAYYSTPIATIRIAKSCIKKSEVL